MDMTFTESFIPLWEKYFTGVGVPIGYFYTNKVRKEDQKETVHMERCLIGNLPRVLEGYTYVYEAHSPGCPGGKRYSGYSDRLHPRFEYFLSCGIPGKMEGERYKKTPQLVDAFVKNHPPFKAPGKYLVFKRIDKLLEDEKPLAVIFFATPDVLSGLLTLANFDRADSHGVVSPMGSGCASIIGYPYQESRSQDPRCVLGMFDISARPVVPAGQLTFTIPMQRFEQMVGNMEESFLITRSWELVKKRL
jgi:hypothetical protein